MGGDQNTHQSTHALDDRAREFTFWAGVIGLFLSAAVYLSIYLSGDLVLHYKISSPTYAVLLCLMVFSGYRRYRIKLFTNISVGSIFAVFWLSTYAEAIQGNMTFVSTPLVLFVPILLMMVLQHRLVFALSPVQFGLVLHYSYAFGTPQYAAVLPRSEQLSFSLALAILSAVCFVAVAIVSQKRQWTDEKLNVVVEEQTALASTDALTRLLNRRAFMEQLDALWEQGRHFTLAFVDLDNFKPLNDELGHAAGDTALTTIADRLRAHPMVHIAARLGGDEFAIIIEAGMRETAMSDIIVAIHEDCTQPIWWESSQMSVGASIGYAEAPQDAKSVSMLLRAADAAMRRVKAGAHGCAQFNPALDNTFLHSSKLEIELPRALENEQIRAALQPIINARSQEIVGYELLARWVNSDFLKDPAPDAFIPAAVKLGLLNDILWVTLDEALARIELDGVSLSINISPAQLLSDAFLKTLTNRLEAYDVDPAQITLEITEQIAMRNLNRCIEVLERARSVGFSVALDDFGTGYSSLSMLAQLPISKLKIDRSFVLDAGSSQRHERILRSAIKLAKELDVICCVEGVETEDQCRRATALGADELQGYLIGRPVMLDQWIDQRATTVRFIG